MSSRAKHLALAKLLAAAAWADGHVDATEANALKAFMVRAGLEEDAVREVMLLLDSPVPESEAEALTAAFLEELPAGVERAALLGEIEKLLAADGTVTDEEARFLATVRDAADTRSVVDVVLGRVRGVVGGLFGGGSRTPSSLADVLRSRVQDRVRARLEELSREATVDAETLNRAALFGAILQKVARADGTVTDKELAALGEVLRRRFDYTDLEAETITSVVAEQVTDDVDLRRLVAEFNRIADDAARTELLEALFIVAAAEGGVAAAEVEEIRRTADFLWIDRRTFNEIRLRHTPR